jgi:hypothetical protein
MEDASHEDVVILLTVFTKLFDSFLCDSLIGLMPVVGNDWLEINRLEIFFFEGFSQRVIENDFANDELSIIPKWSRGELKDFSASNFCLKPYQVAAAL